MPTVTPQLSDLRLEDVQRELARKRLRDYLRLIVWPVIEPMTPFVPGWHLDALCDHLQAVVRGQIRNLLINVAPRTGKSILTSVAMPTWAWIDHPEVRFLYASFSADLSTEHAVLSRRVIESPIYQRHWGTKFALQTDQNIKTFYENTQRGYRISTSIGGTTLGRGGDILVLDDPNNLQTIDSERERIEVQTFYTQVWSGRMNDPKTAAKVVIQQRGHEQDLSGYLREQGGYVELILPTEYDSRAAVTVPTPLGWVDPRTTDGALLHPARLGPTEVAAAKRELGPVGFATQHQQTPMPFGGVLFERAKFKVIARSELPKEAFVDCRGWDQAATLPTLGKDPDWMVGAKLRRYKSGRYVVLDVVRGRFGPEAGDSVLLTTAQADGLACLQREEQEGGSAGKKVIASHARLLEAFDYEGVPKTVNKVVYAKPFAVRVDAGDVWLLDGEWVTAFLAEFCLFPHGKHDDQVDATNTAFHALAARVIESMDAKDVLALARAPEASRAFFERRRKAF